MKKIYDVCLDGKRVGIAEIAEEGLYYRVCCKCHFPVENVYRIYVQDSEQVCDLGTYVPTAESYGISTLVAKKRIREGTLSFFAKGKNAKETELFIPIYPDKPFPYLSELKKARFSVKNGVPGIILKNIQFGSDGA